MRRVLRRVQLHLPNETVSVSLSATPYNARIKCISTGHDIHDCKRYVEMTLPVCTFNRSYTIHPGTPSTSCRLSLANVEALNRSSIATPKIRETGMLTVLYSQSGHGRRVEWKLAAFVTSSKS